MEIARLISQTEKQFQAAVVQYAKLKGWEVYHTEFSIRSNKGFPDLTLARIGKDGTGRIIFAELKSEKGKVTEDQKKWLELLSDCPCETYLWRPSDWDWIEEILK